MRRWSGLLRSVATLAAYVAAVVYLTFPLAARLSTHHPRSWWGVPFDLYQSTWALAWVSDVLLRDPGRLADANIYHPAPLGLFYGQSCMGALPLFAPAYWLSGNPTLAINVTLLAGLALTAHGLHLVARRWTGSHAAGVVAAATFLTNGFVLWWFVPTAPHWAALMWLPWIVLLAAERHERLGRALWLAPLIVAQSLTDPVYLTPAIVAPLGVIAAARLARRETRAAGARLGAAVSLGAVVMIAAVIPYLWVRAANPDLDAQTNWVHSMGVGPFGATHPIQHVPPVTALVLVGGIVAARRRRTARVAARGAWAAAATWTVVGTLVSLPVVFVVGGFGGREVPTPLGVLSQLLPGLELLRVPSRLAVGGLMGLALLCGLSFAAIVGLIQERVDRPGTRRGIVAASVVAWIVTVAAWAVPPVVDPIRPRYPLSPAPAVPASFEPFLHGGGPLLRLPLGRDDVGPSAHAVAMYRSIGRWHPLLNGYGSYWPQGFRDRMSIARRLPAPSAVQALRETAGLRLVWVDLADLPRTKRRRWTIADGRAFGMRRVAKTPTAALFAVDPSLNQ